MLTSYIVTPPASDEGYELALCAECLVEWPESELNQDGLCPDCAEAQLNPPPKADKFAERDEAQIVKRQPKSVVYDSWKV
jgi:hypothetical protein